MHWTKLVKFCTYKFTLRNPDVVAPLGNLTSNLMFSGIIGPFDWFRYTHPTEVLTNHVRANNWHVRFHSWFIFYYEAPIPQTTTNTNKVGPARHIFTCNFCLLNQSLWWAYICYWLMENECCCIYYVVFYMNQI